MVDFEKDIVGYLGNGLVWKLEHCNQWRRHVEVRVFTGTPWPEKKKKIIYNNLNFFIYLPLNNKIGTPKTKSGILSKNFMPNKFWTKKSKTKKILCRPNPNV